MKKLIERIFTRKNDQKSVNPEISIPERTGNTDEIYSADAPVSNPDLDEFNRREYSERIAQTIASRKETKSLVVVSTSQN